MAITSPPDSGPTRPLLRRHPRRGPRTGTVVAILSVTVLLALAIAGPASAAKAVKGTASVALSHAGNCDVPITYTWSNFGGPREHVDAYVSLYLREPGQADVLITFSQQSESPPSAVARGGSFTWQSSAAGLRQWIQSADPHGAAQLVAKGALIHEVKNGTAIVVGSEVTSAPITLPMACRPACDYLTYEACLVLGNIVLRESVTDFGTTPPTINYVSNTTYTLGGKIWAYPSCIGYPGCPDGSSITITGSGTFSTSTGLSGTWTASYTGGPFSWEGGLAPSCQMADVRYITPTLTFTFGSGGTGQAYLYIRTDATATGPTFDYVQLVNSSGGMPTGNFHTGDLTQLMINC